MSDMTQPDRTTRPRSIPKMASSLLRRKLRRPGMPNAMANAAGRKDSPMLGKSRIAARPSSNDTVPRHPLSRPNRLPGAANCAAGLCCSCETKGTLCCAAGAVVCVFMTMAAEEGCCDRGTNNSDNRTKQRMRMAKGSFGGVKILNRMRNVNIVLTSESDARTGGRYYVEND